MAEESEGIRRAKKRLENAEVRVIFRGEVVVKIPAQTIKSQERDGVITIWEIPADII